GGRAARPLPRPVERAFLFARRLRLPYRAVIAAFWFAQGVALAAGAVLLLALRAWRLPPGLFVVTAWLAGAGLLAAEHLLLALVGRPWSPLWLALPWPALAILAAGQLALTRPTWPAAWARLRAARRGPIPFRLVVEVGVVAALLGWTALLWW